MGTKSTDFDLSKAITLAKASAAAYCDSASAIASELGAEGVEAFSSGPTSGYVVRLGNEVILAFRGTISPLDDWEQSLKQWIANLDFGQVVALDGRVHRGFFLALDQVWSRVSELVAACCKDKDSRLWVTGHSLGGALAILAGARLAGDGIMPAGVYTFGAPSVGDDVFAAAYKPPLHRLEHGNDIVCHLPPPLPLVALMTNLCGKINVAKDEIYKPVGLLTYLDASGKHRTALSDSDQRHVTLMRVMQFTLAAAESGWSRLVNDHGITAYLSKLSGSRITRSSFMFEVSGRVLEALNKGTLVRKGLTLRDKATNKTFAYLQETRSFQTWIDRKSSGGVILSARKLASSVPVGDQIDQIKSMCRGLQLLTTANLAASVIGIGVSVAGFALVLNRLKRVEVIVNEATREAVAARLAAVGLDVKDVIRNRANTLHLLELAEAAWHYSEPVRVWEGLNRPMLQQLTYEQCLLGKAGNPSIFLDPRFQLEEAIKAYESVLLLASAHIQTLFLTGEDGAALFFSEKLLQWHETVFQLRPDDIARSKSQQLALQYQVSEDDARTSLIRQAHDFKKIAGEIHRQSLERIDFIRYLKDRGISGRAYIEAARDREDTPFLLLPRE